MSQPSEISYASPDVDHIPPVIEGLEASLVATGHFGNPYAYLANAQDAATYFKRSLARWFSIDSPNRLCSTCGTLEPDAVLLVNIKVTVRAKFWSMKSHATTSVRVVMPCCRRCYKRSFPGTQVLQASKQYWWLLYPFSMVLTQILSQLGVFGISARSGASIWVILSVLFALLTIEQFVKWRTPAGVRLRSNKQLTYTLYRWKLYSRSKRREFLLQTMRQAGPVHADEQPVAEAILVGSAT